MREPGIYSDIDIDEYHSEEGISSSGISLILDCPKRYWYEYIGKPEGVEDIKKQRDKFRMGRAVHMLILEPEKFNQTFFCMEQEVNLTTKAGKEAYEEAKREANGRDIIRANEALDILAIASEARRHPFWEKIKDGKVEQSIYWDGGIYNTRLRARPDIYNNKLIVDVKTTDSIPAFARSIVQYGYHRQAAMQLDGLKHFDGKSRWFTFFVIEKKPPYLTACFTFGEEFEQALQQGRQEYLDGAATYSECLKANDWPGYPKEVQRVELPKWAQREDEL